MVAIAPGCFVNERLLGKLKLMPLGLGVEAAPFDGTRESGQLMSRGPLTLSAVTPAELAAALAYPGQAVQG